MQKVGRADREGKAVFKFCLIRGGGGERQGRRGVGVRRERQQEGRWKERYDKTPAHQHPKLWPE